MTDNVSRLWRDPDALPDYLEDELEHSIFHHSMSITQMAALSAGLMSSPEDPLLFDPREEQNVEKLRFESLKRLAPAATGYYWDVEHFLKDHSNYNSPVQLIGHLLRELESTLRGAWWALLDFSAPEATKLTKEDEVHSQQIKILSDRFGLSSEERTTWLHARNLNRHAHYRVVGVMKIYTPEFEEEARHLLNLFKRIAHAAEDIYGAALLRIAPILSAGPSQAPKVALTQHIPNNPVLRQWFLAQIDDPKWLPVLQRLHFLDDAVDMYWQNGAAVMPVSHAARTVARLAGVSLNSEVLNSLVGTWMNVDNPRVHCDAARILQSASEPIYLNHVSEIHCKLAESPWHARIIRVLGGPGVLRFPSEALRLSLRAHRDGNKDIAEALARAVAKSLHRFSSDDDRRNTTHHAILGTDVMNKAEYKWLLKNLKQD